MTIPVAPVAGPVLFDDEAWRRRAMRRRTVIGLALSLAVHALLLVSFHRELALPGVESEKERAPLIVELGPPSQSSQPVAPAQPAQPPVAPPPVTPPSAKRKPPPSVRRPETPVARAPRPLPPAPPSAQEAPPADLSAMIAARRAQRAAAQPPAPAEPERPDSEAAPATQGNEIALENIQRSLKQGRGREGTNGLFRILHKGPRSASFSFRGWSTDSSKHWNQVIEVDAGPNGDVEHAIVRKMIELIRQHHLEDFYWDSHRLGRVVKLSARVEDSASLEQFLMQEFFGNG